MHPMRLTIRPLVAADRPQWEPLWAGYLAFYKTKLAPEVTDAAWTMFHDPAEPVHALGAFGGDQLVGFVHYVFHRATWTKTQYCYLEDLFVAPDQRGQHVGRALIEAVYKAADAHGATRVYWLTHETNYPGRALYDQVATNAGFIQYRR